jgi:hypothetical protein
MQDVLQHSVETGVGGGKTGATRALAEVRKFQCCKRLCCAGVSEALYARQQKLMADAKGQEARRIAIGTIADLTGIYVPDGA